MEIEGHEAEWMNDMNERAIPKATLSDYYMYRFLILLPVVST